VTCLLTGCTYLSNDALKSLLIVDVLPFVIRRQCISYFARRSSCKVLRRARLCVCMSVCSRWYLRNHTRILTKFCAWSFSGMVAICYVLLVLWMTLWLVLYNGPFTDMNFATKDRFRLFTAKSDIILFPIIIGH